MTQPTPKKQYDTLLKSRVKSAHEYMLAKEILHNLQDVIEYSSVKERARYNIIQEDASSHTHQNSGFEAQERKYKMTSKQVLEVDHLLEDDNLGLEAKALPWEALAAEVKADVMGQIIGKTMNIALCYCKR